MKILHIEHSSINEINPLGSWNRVNFVQEVQRIGARLQQETNPLRSWHRVNVDQETKPLGARLYQEIKTHGSWHTVASLSTIKATWGMALPRNKATSVMATTPALLRNIGRPWDRVNVGN